MNNFLHSCTEHINEIDEDIPPFRDTIQNPDISESELIVVEADIARHDEDLPFATINVEQNSTEEVLAQAVEEPETIEDEDYNENSVMVCIRQKKFLEMVFQRYMICVNCVL